MSFVPDSFYVSGDIRKIHHDAEKEVVAPASPRLDVTELNRDDIRGTGAELWRIRGKITSQPSRLASKAAELKDPVARIFDSVGILTAESSSTYSRSGKEAQAYLRFIAVYAEEDEAIRLVHFQSTTLSLERESMDHARRRKTWPLLKSKWSASA